jgi:Phytanoyl-CoA dioxygenase (PhyH)
MDDWIQEISSGGTLPEWAACNLHEKGFVIIPGPVPPAEMTALAEAYDMALATADPGDVSQGRTTSRMHDLVNRGPAFDSLYVYPPILEACALTIGRPFKLSTLLARTLRPDTPSQTLHADFSADADGWPMLGFILMVDAFQPENGATRFVPRSHYWHAPPSDFAGEHENQILACGPAGSVVVYNGSVWHGHSANRTGEPRRSIQGAYVRRDAPCPVHLPDRMRPETLNRLGPLARGVLNL